MNNTPEWQTSDGYNISIPMSFMENNTDEINFPLLVVDSIFNAKMMFSTALSFVVLVLCVIAGLSLYENIGLCLLAYIYGIYKLFRINFATVSSPFTSLFSNIYRLMKKYFLQWIVLIILSVIYKSFYPVPVFILCNIVGFLIRRILLENLYTVHINKKLNTTTFFAFADIIMLKVLYMYEGNRRFSFWSFASICAKYIEQKDLA